MFNLNNVVVSGNISSDIGAFNIKNGNILFTFSIAVHGTGADSTSFFDIKYFGKKIDGIGKGDAVIVSGYLKQDKWESEGQKRYKVCVYARDICKVIPSSKSGNEESATPEYENKSNGENEDLPF